MIVRISRAKVGNCQRLIQCQEPLRVALGIYLRRLRSDFSQQSVSEPKVVASEWLEG